LKDRMRKLMAELNEASSLYYNGKESPLTDAEFDQKLDELKRLEQKARIIYANSPTIKVGAPVLTELKEIQIKDKPMLSLKKVHSAEEVVEFAQGTELIASIKCDGLSVRLIYENTDLISANTRGTGTEGADITEHVKHFLNVPLKIAKAGRYIIDGEAIIFQSDFDYINKNNDFKNPRNTASGALSLLDTSIVKKRRLSFIAWDVIEGGSSDFYHYNLEEAEKLGFTVVPALAVDATKVEEEEISSINEDLISLAEKEGIPCDGVVWRINSNKEGSQRGQTAHHFLNAIAYKPKDEEHVTRLRGIDYDISRNGILTPVAVFDPIEIDGSIVERASLHNMSIMEEVLGDTPYSGEKIWVVKSNKIIPQIIRAKKMTYGDIISHGGVTVGLGGDYGVLCPCCGHPTSIKTSESGVKVRYCDNDQCCGKLINVIEHFASKKGLDIKGLSKATIEKLIDWNWLTCREDLFKLAEHKEEWIKKPGFGAPSVNKILKSIEEHKKTTLAAFLSSLGIPLIGQNVSKELAKNFKEYSIFRDKVKDEEYDFSVLDGFGEEMNKSLKSYDYTEADKIVTYLSFAAAADEVTDLALSGKIVVITGKLSIFKNRTELKSAIEERGGKVTGSISGKTSFLINNDLESNSSKNLAAKKLNVPILSESAFVERFLEK
jgi:DNA ligase (NAD+)